MSSAKIVVLSLKEIIRVALFVIFILFVVILLSMFFFPKSESTSSDNTIEAQAVTEQQAGTESQVITEQPVTTDQQVATEPQTSTEMQAVTEEQPVQTSSNVGLKDGEFTSRIDIDKGNSYVKVTVANENIANVEIVEQDELAKSFYPLLETVCNDINEKVSTENSIEIETDYYNQCTTAVLTDAINNALASAKIN